MPRVKKFGRNRYKGNQFENCNDDKPEVSCSSVVPTSTSRPSLDNRARPSSSSNDLNTSSSENKLYHVKLCGEDSDYLPERNTNGNIVINLELLNKNLLSSVKCGKCDSFDSISLYEKPLLRKGLAVQLVLFCNKCGFEKDFYSSKLTENNSYDINLRYVYGLRSIGKGKAAAEVLCAVMDLPKPPTVLDFRNIMKLLVKQQRRLLNVP